MVHFTTHFWFEFLIKLWIIFGCNVCRLTNVWKCVKHAGQIFSKTKELNISKRKHYITACVSHHWSPSYNVEVVEKAFGVVDGWTQKRVWFTPLTIQIFAVQVTAISEETDNNKKNKYLHLWGVNLWYIPNTVTLLVVWLNNSVLQ